jgi:hypothetical protein
MMIRPWLLGGALLALAGIAAADKPAVPAGDKAADKPSAEQAKKTAEQWLAGLHIDEETGKPDDAVPLTAGSLFAVAFSGGPGPNCDAVTARTPAAIAKALGCLRKVITESSLEPWTKEAAKGLAAPLRQYKAKLATLEKTATLVHHHDRCVGEGGDLIIAVGNEAAKDQAAAPRVVAVFSQHLFCGE